MKTPLTYLFLLLFCLPLSGQKEEMALARRYNIIADSFGLVPRYKEAILYRKKALNIYQNMKPVPYEAVVNVFRSLGYYYRKSGNLKEGEYHQKRAMELAAQKLNENNAEVVKAFNGYGILLLTQGKYRQSLEYLTKALTICQRINCPDVGDQFNNIGIVHESLGDYDTALENYRKALQFNLKQFGRYSEKASSNFTNLGTVSYNMGQLDMALAYFDTTKLVYDSIIPPNHPDYASLFNNIGAVYNSIGDYKKSIEYLDKSLAIYEKHLGTNHPEVANTYANTGILLLDRGDLDKALSYFQKAYNIRQNNFGDSHPLVARTCTYLGNVYIEKKDFNQAHYWLNRGLKAILNHPESLPNEIADARNDLGLYFEKMGNFGEALRQYNEALSINSRKLDKTNTEVSNSYARIGNVYLTQKEYDKAVVFFNKSLAIRLKVFGQKHPEVADLYGKLALSCPADEACALEFCQKAFDAINYNPGQKKPFEEVISPIQLLKIIQTKGSLLHSFYDSTGKAAFLNEADRLYQTGYQLIDFIKNKLEEPGSRQALLDNFFLVYEEGILVKYKLKTATGDVRYWKEAFEIAERSNSTILLEALRTVQAERFAGIPDSLLEKERKLKIDLAFFEKQRFEEEMKGASANRAKVNKLIDKIFSLKSGYQSLMSTFRNSYPDYFALKYTSKIVSAEQVQQSLLVSKQTMLSYFVGENNIFAFVISKEGFDVIQIKKDFPLEAWVEEFRNSIYRFNPGTREVEYLNQKYANIGYELYELIFQPVEPFIHNTALVITPGGVLGYLPFDALLANQPENYGSFDTHDYLVNRYSISYTYSATLLEEMLVPKSKRGGFLGFAPSYPGDTLALRSDPWRAVLGNLKYNKSEVIAIQKIMGGEIYLDSLATEDKFLERAPLARIIHLAVHGKANDQHGEYSYLAFYQTPDSIENELIFVKNLYNLRIQAALVVLSACETGIGELQKGEGIVSLARGFSFAGAASILTTLWSIDDNASAEIMVSFYRYLKKGLTKDAALREAKLEYIRSKKGSNRAHPLFWAAFVPVGNMEAIEETSRGLIAACLIVFLAGSALGYRAWKKRFGKGNFNQQVSPNGQVYN